MAKREYTIHRNADGTVHVTAMSRFAAWAHACFGPKGFEKWSVGLDPDLSDGAACKCGLALGGFRKVNGDTWTDPQFAGEKVVRTIVRFKRKPLEKPTAKRPAKKAAKKAAKKKAKRKAAKRPKAAPAETRAPLVLLGALVRAVRAAKQG